MHAHALMYYSALNKISPDAHGHTNKHAKHGHNSIYERVLPHHHLHTETLFKSKTRKIAVVTWSKKAVLILILICICVCMSWLSNFRLIYTLKHAKALAGVLTFLLPDPSNPGNALVEPERQPASFFLCRPSALSNADVCCSFPCSQLFTFCPASSRKSSA